MQNVNAKESHFTGKKTHHCCDLILTNIREWNQHGVCAIGVVSKIVLSENVTVVAFTGQWMAVMSRNELREDNKKKRKPHGIMGDTHKSVGRSCWTLHSKWGFRNCLLPGFSTGMALLSISMFITYDEPKFYPPFCFSGRGGPRRVK